MSNLHEKVWNKCLLVIKDNITAVSFKTWFEPIVPLKLEKSILTIQVPSPFFFEYLEEKYIDIISKTLRKVLGNDAKLEYNVVMQNTVFANPPYTVKYPGNNKTELKNRPMPLPLDVKEGEIKNPFIIPGIKKIHVDPQLNPTYTFDNFVEGECNRLARSAALAVAKNPGATAFNPLLFYGESGLGKTHLAQSIGIDIKSKNPDNDKIVLYVTANKFQTQYTEAIRNNNINDFLHFYQMIDILIIDDVHEFIGKEGTQNTFFHIFNHLHQSNKQLILTSDRPPVELKGLERRLLSRFKWGLSAEIQSPDFKTRMAILRRKIYKDGIQIPQEILEYIATNVINNVRELEGALISILAQATLNKKEITMETATQIINKLVKSAKREMSVDFIQKSVCDYFDLPVEVLQSKTRKREIVQARQIAMYFSKTLTKASLASIGAQIGGKDHATVLHAYKTVNNLIDTDKKFKAYVDEIRKKLKTNI